MCGIVGVLGKGPVAEQLVDALKRLEYRGYDSAGVATVVYDAKLINGENVRDFRTPLNVGAGAAHAD